MRMRVIAGVTLAALAAPIPSFAKCPPDSVQVGPVCVDKYEASVWSIPDPAGANKPLVKKLQKGKATLADLTGVGATQLGQYSAVFPASFPVNGNWTAPVYAASVPGVLPTASVTWFQAEQACRLAGKRLLTNQEWQAAAAGTPDPVGGVDDGATECNISGPLNVPGNTGSRSACVSTWGAFDMVGNVWEWVADWGPSPTACPGWRDDFSDDFMCLSGASATAMHPGALVRGGDWLSGGGAGVFAVSVLSEGPSNEGPDLGFRCAR